MKTRCTITLDEETLKNAQEKTDNLSETINTLLLDFIRQKDREAIIKNIKEYEKESKLRREKMGIFSSSHRKFL